MAEFDDRLRRAVERGERRRANRDEEARQAALDESDMRNRHSRFRLQLSEYIERCLQRLPDYLPGFRYEIIFGERGWGAACSRDDLQISEDRQRSTVYSRLEMTVRPYSDLHILEIIAKGTIRNREIFHRNYYELLRDADPQRFEELIDTWTVEYVEQFTAT